MERLGQWRSVLAKDAPSGNLTAYFAFRELAADYGIKLSAGPKGEELPKLQEEWRAKLTKFVDDYGTSDDAPEAVMQLGMANEFAGKETEAKNWYSRLIKHYEKHAHARKAAGALKRLAMEGQEFELAGKTLGGGTPFDFAKSMKGKVVLVYYWASWNKQCESDFAKLKQIVAALQPKGLELVCVNLDNAEADALAFLRSNQIPATHLYEAGGLDSPLASGYGVLVLPNLFVVGSDGKVVSRNSQVATLEDDLKKAMKAGDKDSK